MVILDAHEIKDLLILEKVSYLEEWIPAKVKVVFEVVSVSGEE